MNPASSPTTSPRQLASSPKLSNKLLNEARRTTGFTLEGTQSAPATTAGSAAASISSSEDPSPVQSPDVEARSAWLHGRRHGSTSSMTEVRAAASGNLSRHSSFAGDRRDFSAGSTIAKPDYSEAKIVVAMVGLPARGKSYLSNKLQRYLRWLEYDVKVFNVGQLRRQKAQAWTQMYGNKQDHSATFFDNKNEEANKQREELAAECLESLITWLKDGGNVGIHDATNTTRARRQTLIDRVKKEPNLRLIFLESICTDPDVISANIDHKVASGDPDYDGIPKEQARKDFLKRIQQYEARYEPIDPQKDAQMPYCKIINIGNQVIVNKIDGYLQSRIVFYLMNLHLTPRAIFVTRHGESQYNVEGKIGGDAPLSTRGAKYAAALPNLVKEHIGDKPLTVWTSTLRRTIQTAEALPYTKLTWKSLDELDAGVCDGMTYEEIEQEYPEDFAARDDDKFNYRYRGGESYRDVVVRLEPVIMELERQENILLVCHQAVVRCLYAYFHGLDQEELPYISIPLHTVIKLTPRAFGCDETRYTLPIEAVDTLRPRPLKDPKSPVLRPKPDEFVSPSTRAPERQVFDNPHAGNLPKSATTKQ
ncbi:uncharacterized protein L969DRAFT_97010 [Mixia osmundae IAM 14324]|uniref:fructose-2,6-bisphosphate 2-phosphatase n=1 Tax=Mixia osmundae (strain CBS 9802 / IAM 14324 / JCM 22182 / KY 12970) TaxID=764103 RepID=G7E1E4_MIXOS|nr:uncharacterized protein L969DRAFT_97010 [Mixia osmundae IAM 14324]KEI36608.1 hypothetical protein L969DRAFT_97010 [Mixia osmundae IAM 14324]GAA96654.1 hypothetical protein E5Q_03325 [Mixia osmundae IAM 14324]